MFEKIINQWEQTMNIGKSIFAILVMMSLIALNTNAGLFGNKKDADEKREETLIMRDKTLLRLYRENSAAKEMVDNAVGYAVFANTGINVLLVSTASGKGVAHDNEANQDTYMNMFSAGGGFGMGIKKFSAVFVFHSRDAFEQFVEEGWNFTGQVDAAATTDAEEGGEAGTMGATVGLNESVTVYQMTEKGLALQATLQGTKYSRNDQLN
ncbi:MAG: lipid-binding SYLF domain-containing protein [Halioglobus sp.]